MLVTGNLMRAISRSRAVAFDVLERIAAGAYASDTLRLESAGLEPRDAGLAVQIVFGCLRYQGQLDYLIHLYSGRNPEEFDLAVKIALRSGIFQLRYLERIPAHAAVHDAVEFTKLRKRAAAGLVNAVLRKVNRSPVKWPDEATELSLPDWLLRRWAAHFGPEQARKIARAALHEPLAYIRIPPGSPVPAGLETEPTRVAGAHRLLSPLETGIRLQDISSQAIIPLLDLSAGQTYLDLCSAPGNKTLQALESPLKLAIACDISETRIRDVPPVCPRVVLDAAEPLPFSTLFDRVFIDAPCSGTGTLARNPEIKWRLQEPDLARFREKQVGIVKQALKVLAPEGKLLYATCSLEREENEYVVTHVLTENKSVVCEREVWRLPGRDEGDGFYSTVLVKSAESKRAAGTEIGANRAVK
jgi:16S rRNA (cytosine967-C5)-methyltransferase